MTSGLTDEVLLLDADDGRIVRRIPVDVRPGGVDEPHGITIAPDGRHWYLTLFHGNPTLWKFEMPEDRLVGRVRLGTSGAARIGIAPDGRRAFIPDYDREAAGRDTRVVVVELDDLSIVARPTVCPAPHDARVQPGGRLVAIACSMSDEIVLLDASSLAIVDRFRVDPGAGPPGSPRFKPLNLLWSPGGDTLFVALHRAARVRAFDAAGRALGDVTVGAGPTQMALSDDGKLLVVANRNDRSISLVSTGPLAERKRVPVGRPHPHGIALDDRARTAFVTFEGDPGVRGGVVAVDTDSGDVVWTAEAGVYTLGIAYAPS